MLGRPRWRPQACSIRSGQRRGALLVGSVDGDDGLQTQHWVLSERRGAPKGKGLSGGRLTPEVGTAGRLGLWRCDIRRSRGRGGGGRRRGQQRTHGKLPRLSLLPRVCTVTSLHTEPLQIKLDSLYPYLETGFHVILSLSTCQVQECSRGGQGSGQGIPSCPLSAGGARLEGSGVKGPHPWGDVRRRVSRVHPGRPGHRRALLHVPQHVSITKCSYLCLGRPRPRGSSPHNSPRPACWQHLSVSQG